MQLCSLDQVITTLRNLTTGVAKVARVHAEIIRLKNISWGKAQKGRHFLVPYDQSIGF